MTTKEQERKALAQIRKIVEGLGQDSYIGTAFEGCFEIAEENIENDFACSMKQRAESAERMLATASSELRDLKASVAELTEKCSSLESKAISPADACAIAVIMNEVRKKAAELADDAAERIVDTAEKPDSAEFRQAVEDHRASKKRAEDCGRLIQLLRNK